MQGKKVVIGLMAMVILVGAITFTLYLLTRQVQDDVAPTPSGMTLVVEAPAYV